MKKAMSNNWGFLRETEEKAKEAGLDKDTGLHRTGLEEYLKVIFPETNDWIHDEKIEGLIVDGKQSRLKPDYRSESLKLIVEFDGTHHYKYPDTIDADLRKTKIYEQHGYKVVRIPFFIQLTKEAVKKLFNVDLDFELFDGSIPSLGVKGRNSPACLCSEGVKRMAREFKKFPEQYTVNLNALKQQGEPFKTGIETLEDYYNSIP